MKLNEEIHETNLRDCYLQSAQAKMGIGAESELAHKNHCTALGSGHVPDQANNTPCQIGQETLVLKVKN